MTHKDLCANIDAVIGSFDLKGTLVSKERYGNGHINDTFKVVTEEGGEHFYYILQRINREVFKDPEKVMENIVGVTSFLRGNIEEEGGNPDRETLTVILTKDQHPYLIDENESYWRAYLFIDDAISYEKVEKPEDFYQSAIAFGRFQYLLSEFDASKLHETIKDFHHTPMRFKQLEEAVRKDSKGRLKDVEEEVKFFADRVGEYGIALDMLHDGQIKLRVTHNDTKLNNIMIDTKTGDPIAVIDLDTVMPGLAINDFGDSIRFGANTALEDEQDLSKVSLDLNLFEVYTKGYIEGTNGRLTETEIEMLPMGAKLMTMECGMRFLADHLNGDVYFRTHRENHNLDRARTQIALTLDMEKKWSQMSEIVSKYNHVSPKGYSHNDKD